MIIQIIGLPGSGKTTLSEALSDKINGFHINADKVRQELNSDLGFEIKDRVEQARRMGALARLVEDQGHIAVVDFVCPTKETRKAFGNSDIVIWVNRIEEGRFENTNKIWEDPEKYDIEIKYGQTVDEEVEEMIHRCGLFDWKKPSTLMLGRYQPWHEGHHALYVEAGKRTNQVILGVRNTYGTSEKDPLPFSKVKEFIDKDPIMKDAMVIKMPNITNIVYGRDVGYKIEQIELPEHIQAISATQKRKEMGL
jgi:adenylate kinase family enzyme